MKYILVAMPQVLWFLLTPALLLSQPVPAPAAAPVSDMAPSPMSPPPTVLAPVSDMMPSPMSPPPAALAPVSDMAPSPMSPPPAALAPVSDMAPSPMSPPPPDCPSRCGKVDIPYPFGIGDNCALLPGFVVTCNGRFNPPRPYLGNAEVINVTLETGEMRVSTRVSYVCYNSDSTIASEDWGLSLTGSPFLISSERNVFTAIGCSTLAYLEGRDDLSYFTGCITTCESLEGAANDGDKCTGLGCCQAPILSNLSKIAVGWGNTVNHTFFNNPDAWRYSPCSYAFVAEKDNYNFSQIDLNGTGDRAFDKRVGEKSIPLVLDWAITSNGRCPPSPANPTAPACRSNHSNCTNTAEGSGYLCHCSKGYSGNPYVTGGCTNINECELRKSDPKTYEKQYPCKSGSTCRDTEGDYECKCNWWKRGDGKSDMGCQPVFSGPAVATVVILVALGVLLVGLWFILWERKRRQQRGFFDKNGGKILKNMNINIFTKAQLNKITNNYSNTIGNGSFGKVCLGTTDDNQQVAVKVSKSEACVNDDFVNEIIIQSQISHVNLVRLLGCCLETNVPMLVFEFVANGSLYNMLHVDHGTAERRTLSLSERLDIAIGSAEALVYMHFQHASLKILHGDVKSSNILLDEHFQPKVSDFGLSKLLSSREKKYARLVIGDIGYMDPVYMKTGLLTEKSDVYSFGVVLLELITGKEARYNGNNSLPIEFKKSYDTTMSRAREMLDEKFTSAADIDCLEKIGAIAVQCLKEYVDDRPTMAQVVDDLKQVKLRTYTIKPGQGQNEACLIDLS